jgi:hypothetical protein
MTGVQDRYAEIERTGEGVGSLRLTYQDILHTRLAGNRAPLVDLWLAVASVKRGRHNPLFTQRRRRLRGQITGAAAPLSDLVNANGDGPDFLAPICSELDEAIDAILSTPTGVVRAQLENSLTTQRRVPSWVREFADGDRDARAMLIEAIRSTYRDLLLADDERLRDSFDRDLAWRGQQLVSQGLGAVLDTLPNTRWTGDALVSAEPADSGPSDGSFGLDGAEIVLLPSATWIGEVLLGRAPDGTWLLVYAALETPEESRSGDPLAALLGRTRAGVLRLLSHPRSTTEVARILRISPASASEHAAILRAAGLVVSRRAGAAILHCSTALGRRLGSR